MITILATLLLMPALLVAMDDFLEEGVLFQGDADSEVVYISGEHVGDRRRKIPEVYDKFYRSFADTAQEHDTTQRRHMHNALFMQLCVQASKARTLDMKPFQELLYKIRSGIINYHTELVHMTEKDLEYRLLSYIPYGTIHALVNDKKVRFWFERKTAAIKQPMPAKYRADLFPEDPSQGSSWTGDDIVDTGELELKILDYDFTANQTHHGAVVEMFNKLIG
jgi:hypothetical protein